MLVPFLEVRIHFHRRGGQDFLSDHTGPGKGSVSSLGALLNPRETMADPFESQVHQPLPSDRQDPSMAAGQKEVGRHRATFLLATQPTHPPSMWAASFARPGMQFSLQPPPLLSCPALAATLI